MMQNYKLEDSQTYRYHKDCGNHKCTLIPSDEQSIEDIPMLSLVKALHEYITLPSSMYVFPAAITVIRCDSGMSVYGTQIKDEDKDTIHEFYGIMCGAAIGIAAKAKDKHGFNVKFRDITEDYEASLARAQSMDEIKSVLEVLKVDLENME